MSKKKWLLILLCILIVAAYFKLFFKSFSETAVAKSADVILALDVKRVTNTVIWNLLTTPSQWKKISYSNTGNPGWMDMLKMPDYVFIFHAAGQPANAWYGLFEIKNEEDFINGMRLNHFEKGDSVNFFQYYSSGVKGIEMIRSGNKLLIGNQAVENKSFITQIAREIFVEKQFLKREKLFKNIEAGSHLSIVVGKNNFLQQDAVVKINFNKSEINVGALLNFKKQFTFTENDFGYSTDALCSTGFTQPSPSLYNLVPAALKAKISKAINFNVDSLLLPDNDYYRLSVQAIEPKVDSAISYEYDDNFNQVEKVVLNNILEPSMEFSIHGAGIYKIYNYWSDSGQIEKTTSGNLFLPMPFAKSYCKMKGVNELSIVSTGFQNLSNTNSINCIFFLKLLLTKIPVELLKYLPPDLLKSISNLESIVVTLKKDGESIKLDARARKKDNDRPIVNL